MAAIYGYSCQNCAYEAEVAGGVSSGMLRAHSLTISCHDCNELYDVDFLEPVHDYRRPDLRSTEDPKVPPLWTQRRLRCPEDASHRWEIFEGFCPVCGDRLDRTQEPVLLSD